MKTLPTKNIVAITVIAASIIIFLSCQKTDSTNVAPNQPPVTVVTASIAGRVTDISNVPVGNASVSAGVYTTTTDINGQFTLKNILLNKDTGFVKITKPGYFLGSRTFLVNANTTNNVKIQLIPKTVSGNFDAASGGNINVPGGGSVNFGTGGIVNEASGSAYTGKVSVSTFYLNPFDANFNEYMPGDLRVISTGNQQKILHSFGMVLVEMNDASGAKLQLATGKTATITLPIPSALRASAPASLPLWYFDEIRGVWREEGSAAKQGNNYVGTVAHFSFWTAGQLGQSVRLDATFKDSAGKLLANKLVTLSSIDSTATYGTTSGYTDSAGTVSGLIPANAILIMKVFDQNGEIYNKSIGPFTTDTNLGIITITISPSLTLSGTVVDCNNNAVATGSVNVFVDNTQWSADVTNGNFTITVNRYNNLTQTATLVAMDKATLQFGAEKIVNITSSNQNVGQLSACAPSYINLTLNGATFSWAPPDSLLATHIDSSGGTFNSTFIQGTSGNWIYFYILNDNASTGSYNITLSTFLNGNSYPNNSATTTVTEYGPIGGYISGTISGQLPPGPFSCSYRVKRSQ